MLNLEKSKRGQLLLAGVGMGKTWIFGGVLRRLRDIEFHKQVGCVSPWAYVVITKASIVEQTRRVLSQQFNLHHPKDVFVINIDQLRSKFGELFVEEKIKIENGEEHVEWIWRPMLYPCVIIWDECQQLKNVTSTQHKIASSFNDLDNTFQIFSSATPFTRVCEAKVFAVSTRIKTKIASFVEAPLDNNRWATFSKMIASPAEPIEHSPAAIDRLMDKLDDYIVRVKGVKPQFHAINSVELIQFETDEGKKYYDDAIDRFLRRKAKLENSNLSDSQKNIGILVAMLQYRKAAETNPDRVSYLCSNMVHSVKEGYAALCAVNFKQTIISCVKKLKEEYKIDRNQVSLIWGGGSSAPTQKEMAKAAITQDEVVLEALKKHNISLGDLDLDDVEAVAEKEELDPTLRLGTQSLKERQNEIDRFQKSNSLFCFFTFRAGGVGLSLHHTDEFTKEKVRHKESGYAFEEDISKIPTRPRITYVAPTWSAIELVQGLGRAPRLTSLSNTIQKLIFFSNTIERKVADIVSLKLRCLTKVVREKQDWSGVITGSYHETEEQKQIPKTAEDEAEEIFGEGEDEN
jgi:hypothetical protein